MWSTEWPREPGWYWVWAAEHGVYEMQPWLVRAISRGDHPTVVYMKRGITMVLPNEYRDHPCHFALALVPDAPEVE